MKLRKTLLNSMILAACGSASTAAFAALPSNAILTFDPGVTTTNSYGTDFVKSGSYFGMDTNGSGDVKANERTAIEVNSGLVIGKSQPASGSHSGAPDGSESPGIDKPWSFFGNTGMHLTSKPVNVLSSAADSFTLDLSGWVVTWNGIESIPMGTGAWAGNSDGVATVTCGTDCSEGDTFTLDYSATVPAGDPSGFGGVAYNLRLTGTINTLDVPRSNNGNYGNGSIATSLDDDGRLSMDDFLQHANGGVEDTGYNYSGGLFDFTVTGIGPGNTTVSVVLPLSAPIPANAVYRKFINGAWTTFTADSANKVQSAAQNASKKCPNPDDPAYVDGLKEGDLCVQLIIEDGGPYDSDNTVDENISDPGGVAAPVVEQIDTRTSGSSGCSMGGNSMARHHADWWLVAGFISLLGWLRFRRKADTRA